MADYARSAGARGVTSDAVLVGHSYGGAVITEAGNLPNVTGLVYVAAFAPDAGESPGQISEEQPPAAFENIEPDSDGRLWVVTLPHPGGEGDAGPVVAVDCRCDAAESTTA